tara:strand:- start:4468 stop:4893 length:426 start_codon:yes stop_codon:yes gene_type:complete
MKKNDLKKIIKPLVKECIHEVLLEEGLLSGIVSEVAQGMQGAVLTESVRNQRTMKEPAPSQMRRKTQNANKKIQEHREKLMSSINSDAYNGVNLFEGTEAMSSYEAAEPKPGSVDLGSPSDAGVDISSLMGGASQIWQAMK